MEITLRFVLVLIFLFLISCLAACGPLLIWYSFNKNKDFYKSHRNLLFIGLVIVPNIIFIASFLLAPEYRSEDDDWYDYIHLGWASMAIWPIYLFASISLTKAIYNIEYMITSIANYIMVITLAAISAWYMTLTSLIFGFSCFNYIIFLIVIYRKNRFQPFNYLFLILGWLSILLFSIFEKIFIAKEFYNRLPYSIIDYNDCFIVSAAANGHPKIVKSTINPNTGKIVNYQLYVFRTFEAKLASSFPNIHRKLRIIYNRIGPCIAKQIRYRWQADVIYLLLKPLELVVRLGLLIAHIVSK